LKGSNKANLPGKTEKAQKAGKLGGLVARKLKIVEIIPYDSKPIFRLSICPIFCLKAQRSFLPFTAP